MVKGSTLLENRGDIITTTTAEDFDEAQSTIRLALYGEGVYKKEDAREHTITYRMLNNAIISEEKAQGYQDASFIVKVHHKKDETVDITIIVDHSVVTKARHRLERILS